jgi:hypothetical protein
VSLASCKQWAAEHGLTVLVKKHNASDYTWAVRLDDTATIDWGRADSEAHAWAAMWLHIDSACDAYLDRAAHLRALPPIHQAPASADLADQIVLNTIRDIHATGKPIRVTDVTHRTSIGPVAIWRNLERLEARGLIHITATGEPLVSVPEAPPARQLTITEGT